VSFSWNVGASPDGPKEAILTSEKLSALFQTEVDVEERNGHYRLW
jgi:iron complex transport system ATP-binding protein